MYSLSASVIEVPQTTQAGQLNPQTASSGYQAVPVWQCYQVTALAGALPAVLPLIPCPVVAITPSAGRPGAVTTVSQPVPSPAVPEAVARQEPDSAQASSEAEQVLEKNRCHELTQAVKAAINNQPEKRATTKDIYRYIEHNHPQLKTRFSSRYYSHPNDVWKSRARGSLVKRELFRKVKEQEGYWEVVPLAERRTRKRRAQPTDITLQASPLPATAPLPEAFEKAFQHHQGRATIREICHFITSHYPGFLKETARTENITLPSPCSDCALTRLVMINTRAVKKEHKRSKYWIRASEQPLFRSSQHTAQAAGPSSAAAPEQNRAEQHVAKQTHTGNKSTPAPEQNYASGSDPTSVFNTSVFQKGAVMAGTEKMITITTELGSFQVWTERHGDNPKIRILLLHGGPGCDHSYLKACQQPFSEQGYEFIYYQQLGSKKSPTGQPDDSKLDALWELPRFVEEVEQVRQALGLGPDNFILYGQSWGGLLAQEYALKYQQHMKALIVSNMMTSCPAYGAYSQVLLKDLPDQDAARKLRILDDIEDKTPDQAKDFEQLLALHYYTRHILRRPLEQWPEEVNDTFSSINPAIYVPMQGPSELGVKGKLARWDRTQDIHTLNIPTLFIGGEHDTMDPRHLEAMAKRVPKGQSRICPNGSHLAMWDDADHYFQGIHQFLAAL